MTNRQTKESHMHATTLGGATVLRRFLPVTIRGMILGHFPSHSVTDEMTKSPCFPEEPRVIGRLFESGVSVPLAPTEATETISFQSPTSTSPRRFHKASTAFALVSRTSATSS